MGQSSEVKKVKELARLKGNRAPRELGGGGVEPKNA